MPTYTVLQGYRVIGRSPRSTELKERRAIRSWTYGPVMSKALRVTGKGSGAGTYRAAWNRLIDL